MNSQTKFQPSKLTIVEVTAILVKTTMTTKETTRIIMRGDIILKFFHELPKNILEI